MAYSIDAAVEILKTIDKSFEGHSGIFAFQRDGGLYLVGKKAVAVVSGGVPCSYYLSHTDATLDSYIKEPFKGKSKIVDEHGGIIKSERENFALLCKDKNGENNSLAELLDIGRTANKKFPDDGRIRMVSHGERYHSHKYGYAADGVDVSLTDARIMMRNEYFDLMRGRELIAQEALDEKNSEGNVSLLQGVVIITNQALLSFPFPTKLRFDGHGRSFERHYEDNSPIVNEDMITFSGKVSSSTESPYSFNVVLLNDKLRFSSPESFAEDYGTVVSLLEKLKDCYTPKVREIIEGANLLHNEKHAEEIASWKKLHEKSQKRA